MKKQVVLVAVAMAVLSVSTVATRASILVNDNFNRANGNLVGTNPTPGPGGTWGTHSGTVGPVQISSNAIQILQVPGATATEDVNIPAGGPMIAGDRWYSGFDVTVNQTGASILNAYFAHFLQGTTNFTSRLWVSAPTSSGFRLALSNDNSNTDNDGEVYTTDLVLGQTYRVVISYDFTGMNGSLWINQALESGSSITATDPGFSNGVTAFAFRQAATAAVSSTQTVDNLCVATTYGEAYTCLPEPATLSLLAFGAVAMLRRRR